MASSDDRNTSEQSLLARIAEAEAERARLKQLIDAQDRVLAAQQQLLALGTASPGADVPRPSLPSSQSTRTAGSPRSSGSQFALFGNPVLFFVLYLVCIIPTYVLPYFGSNSALFGSLIAFQAGANPMFWAHVLCLAGAVCVTWLRGYVTGSGWIVVFPMIGAIFDLTPGFTLVFLLPTLMHVLALVFGVKASVVDTPAIHAGFPPRFAIAAIALLIGAFSIGGSYALSRTTLGPWWARLASNSTLQSPQGKQPVPQTGIRAPDDLPTTKSDTARLQTPPSAKHRAVPDDLLVAPKVGVGLAKFRMSRDQVAKILGQPANVESSATVDIVRYGNHGMTLTFAGDELRVIHLYSDYGASRVRDLRGLSMTGFRGGFRNGLGMTSTMEQVIQELGEPKRSNDRGYLEFSYDSLGFAFDPEAKTLMFITLLGWTVQ